MTTDKDIVEAVSFATLLTSKEVVDIATESEKEGLVMAAVLKDPMMQENSLTRILCVAKFGFFATTLFKNTDRFHRRAAVETATRHLRLGKSMNMALGSSSLSAQISGSPGVYAASCLDVTRGLAIGVSGASQNNNYRVAKWILRATLFYLPMLLGSKVRKPDPDVTQALWVARADIQERFGISMTQWALPADWHQFTFWQQKLFSK